MNEQAKKLNKAFVDQERASFPLYGGEALPLPDHEFHKMISVNTIYFWEYPLTIFEECPRLLAYAKYGFCLHGWDDVEQPVIQASFQIADTQTETEAIERKDGSTVERTFTTITLKA
ncbi:hypothetical protein SAMN06265218_12412 [Fodinibius sediminis]|uniref:Methyltransferase domain-containing protein n=2 Tax=Fodinibius sediminis TaxID=1214077 RepID=A0A521F7I8_9BACT|nr:hypothetical protein SAMN06265218_12412 [Fodinibius sediminis]